MTKAYGENVKCYNCGLSINTKKDLTNEHIPMRCLFTGFKDVIDFKKVITVPAHFRCNNGEYSNYDAQMRDLIAVLGDLNNKDSLSELYEAAKRGARFNEKQVSGRCFIFGPNKQLGLVLDKPVLDKLHVKHFKGLFYHEFNYPLPTNFECIIYSHNLGLEREPVTFSEKLIDVARNRAFNMVDWKYSGHEDVFKYRINTLYVNDIRDLKDNDIIICEMFYCNLVYAVVVAGNRDYWRCSLS